MVQSGVEAFFDVSLWLPNQGVGQQIGGDGFVKHLARALEAAFPLAAERICVPLASMLRASGISRVLLVSCGVLGHFPLHACPSCADDAVALGEEFDVSYIPSAAVLRSLRARSASPLRTRLLTVSDPMPHPRPLRFAAVQQARITDAARRSGMPVRTVAEYEATREAFETAVRDASHVDFACHGWLDQLQAFDSGIELADGPVTLRHLLDSRLLEGVSLVTLTSCQSAVAAGGPFEDEPVSLATGFLMAGARAILGTLWLVDDLATTLLVARFYRHHLLDGLPPTRSLGLAQSWVRSLTAADTAAELGDPAPSDSLHRQIRPFSHPLYWAPYVLTSG
ncbi:CHAT domain-containing protein [Streptomyces sp. NPDC059866]|uniref:CHAT domain-containing protein n=1 Tax=Streptomyces sp. NPDC059866 TaxID=3346978 RepID=UPI00365AB975